MAPSRHDDHCSSWFRPRYGACLRGRSRGLTGREPSHAASIAVTVKTPIAIDEMLETLVRNRARRGRCQRRWGRWRQSLGPGMGRGRRFSGEQGLQLFHGVSLIRKVAILSHNVISFMSSVRTQDIARRSCGTRTLWGRCVAVARQKCLSDCTRRPSEYHPFFATSAGSTFASLVHR